MVELRGICLSTLLRSARIMFDVAWAWRWMAALMNEVDGGNENDDVLCHSAISNDVVVYERPRLGDVTLQKSSEKSFLASFRDAWQVDPPRHRCLQSTPLLVIVFFAWSRRRRRVQDRGRSCCGYGHAPADRSLENRVQRCAGHSGARPSCRARSSATRSRRACGCLLKIFGVDANRFQPCVLSSFRPDPPAARSLAVSRAAAAARGRLPGAAGVRGVCAASRR